MTDEENYCEIEAPVARGEKNLRTATKQAAEKLIDEGRLGGYLTYASGTPIGWCNANDKSCYPRLMSAHPSMEGQVKCIMCFEVLPDHRNCGVASALLRHICDDARRAGYTCVEAYPNKCNMLSENDYEHMVHIYREAGFLCESGNNQDVWVKKIKEEKI